MLKIILSIFVLAILVTSHISAQSCLPPDRITINNLTQTGGTVTWEKVTGAKRYRIEYRKISDINFRTLDATRTTATFRGLASATEYEFRIKTTCDSSGNDVNSLYSNNYSFRTLSFNPGCEAPTNVEATEIKTINPSRAEALISWNGYTTVTGYHVYYKLTNNARYTVIKTGLETKLKLPQLVPDQTYEVKVFSDCNGVLSPASISYIFKTGKFEPSCPQPRVRVNDVKTNSAVVTWDLSMSYYELAIRIVTDRNDGIWESYYLSSSAPRKFENLIPNTPYEVRMRNFCNGSFGEYTTPYPFKTQDDSLYCEKPVLSADILNNTSVKIGWGINVPQFEISYRAENQSTWTIIQGKQQVRSFTVENLSPDTKYTFRVRHFCNDRFSDYSQIIITTPKVNPCNSPQIQVSNVTTESFLLSWNFTMKLYEVSYRNVNSLVWITNYYPGGSSRNFNDLSPNQSYEVKVRNYCNGYFSEYSNTIRFSTLKTDPSCKTPALGMDTITYNSATFIWDVTGEIELSYRPVGTPQNPTQWKTILVSQPAPFTVIDLSASTNYEFKIRNICGGLFSDPSNILELTTPIDPNLCYQPFDFSVDKITDKTVVLSWNTPPKLLSYQIEYREAVSNRWTSFKFSKFNRNITLVGLIPNTAYEVRIKTNCTATEQSDWITFPFTTLTSRVSISENSDAFIIYPNPGKDVLNISSYEEIKTIKLFDLNGKLVLLQSGIDIQGKNIPINTTSLSPGIYQIILDTENQVKHFRWMKE